MTLRAEDGTPLEPKEGVVIDQEGNTLSAPGPHHRYDDSRFGAGTGRTFVWQTTGMPRSPLGWLIWVPLLAILLFVGITFFAVVAACAMALMAIFVLHRWVRRLLSGR